MVAKLPTAEDPTIQVIVLPGLAQVTLLVSLSPADSRELKGPSSVEVHDAEDG